MKPCSICKQPKPYSEFRKDKHRPDGFEVRCKECMRKRGRELYALNREGRLAIKKRDHERHKEERNAKSREYSQYYHEQNKERIHEHTRTWELANPERRREKWRRYVARKKAATVETVDKQAILARDGYCCYICNQAIDPTLVYPEPGSLCFDHVIPFSRGGMHAAENVKPAHFVCNDRKGQRLIDEMTSFQRRGLV